MMTGDAVLNLQMLENDAGAGTIGAYLKTLLTTLWKEEAGFSGKRPFGNSSWKHDIYKALIIADSRLGKLDSDGYVDTIDEYHADELIYSAIEALG